jgi:hypothetical protein
MIDRRELKILWAQARPGSIPGLGTFFSVGCGIGRSPKILSVVPIVPETVTHAVEKVALRHVARMRAALL